jgi:ATP-dependent DNA helicase RecG
MVGALAPGSSLPTLAGLLSLGVYPQQFLPQLDITFVVFPTIDGRPMADGTRFLDNVSIDGSIPQMIDMAEKALIRNMTRRAVITGAGREDVWEFPLEAVRELIVNAIMHRDYHPLAQGTQIRMELYPDRLTITNPGGLFGVADPEALMRTPITSSRNNTLSKLLEDIEMPSSTRTVAENRGSGLIAVSTELDRANMPQACISSTISHFTIELHRQHGSTGTEAVPPLQPSGSDLRQIPQLTPRQTEVLEVLSRTDVTAADISEYLGISRQAVQKHLSSLESKGLVEPTSEKRTSRTTRWHRITN